MDKDQKHIPFAVIVAATNGDETAIQEILDFYDGYISKLSLRKLYDEWFMRRLICRKRSMNAK